MAEQLTDSVEIVSLVKKMCGEAVAECMKTALFGDAGFFFAAYIADDTELQVI